MPSEPKYDLDAELARMVELTRKLAEAMESVALQLRRARVEAAQRGRWVDAKGMVWDAHGILVGHRDELRDHLHFDVRPAPPEVE